ncbi:hypothetical protein F5884DRAFT_825370 [Xylogone sp. PMI_703]|nr:hypothetical protein F5884DRAFT_825370 [Xylogone sp. PMI_703]
MKEAIVAKGPKVTIRDSPVPSPNPDQVLIKVIYSGSNPKDWKWPSIVVGTPHNSGDDIAGIIEAVGDNVVDFKKGDRVAAFHEKVPFKSYYIPLAAMTSAIGLYARLGLPEPWHPATVRTPIIIYGGSSAVGAFAIKLAQASDIHPFIVVAGKGQDYVEQLITRSKGDSIVDYRGGDDAVLSGITTALKEAGVSEVRYAYDAISDHNSFRNIGKILAKPGNKMTVVVPWGDYSDIPSYIEQNITMVTDIFQDIGSIEDTARMRASSKDFGFVFSRLFSRGLQEGWFTPHPYEVVPGGLNGIEKGLTDLMNGVNSATKYVFNVEDTW